MKTETFFDFSIVKPVSSTLVERNRKEQMTPVQQSILPEILFVTSYPPRECGIATYSQDLLKALYNKFSQSFSLKVCALEAGRMDNSYPSEVKHVFDTQNIDKYTTLAKAINQDENVKIVLLQHEFGLFQSDGKDALLHFLFILNKPVIVVFHTVLPNPSIEEKLHVLNIALASASIIVMTKNAAKILREDYGVAYSKIRIIAHGTHLVPYTDKMQLKEKYGLEGKTVLSTFGLLSSGKSIETTLDAMPAIISANPDLMFLVIGKTHPGVVQSEGERYREMLEEKVNKLGLRKNVKFINHYLPLEDLLEFLQLTDIYLFTSKDPNQAVSGTFSYAMSCGCPIVSTPIPHAKELLNGKTGIFIDFQNSKQLSEAVNLLLCDELLRTELRETVLQKIVPTAWENSAISHALLLQKTMGNFYENANDTVSDNLLRLNYRIPAVNLNHVKKMTTDFGMLQFSKINQPDPDSGYTLDDNARAMVSICMHHEREHSENDLKLIRIYLDFIGFCQQSAGDFLNYVDLNREFTEQNEEVNLSDSNGRAIWALGYLIAQKALLPQDITIKAQRILERAAPQTERMHSPRAMAFAIKGLYYANLSAKSMAITEKIIVLADRLLQMYRHESEQNWNWFESYLTYGNSILPEAMLCAFLDTGKVDYRVVAKRSFDFLLSLTFNEKGIKVISNKGWLHKGHQAVSMQIGGEQPIDVAYTILAMKTFYQVFKLESYLQKLHLAFNWFLGNNHLQQIIYNPCTGGCYDGLEEESVNLNQGAESTVSYLMARMTIESIKK